MTWRVIQADVMDGLASLPDASVQTVITSPPYWGLRDYGTAEWEGGSSCQHLKGQAGICPSCGERPCDHLQTAGGTRNNGRNRAASGGMFHDSPSVEPALAVPYKDVCGKCGAVRRDQQLGLEPTPEAYVERMVAVFREVRRVLRPDGTVWLNLGDSYAGSAALTTNEKALKGKQGTSAGTHGDIGARDVPRGLKPKDLVGIPWRVAFALQADGWYLRSDIIWAKPNPMPESVTDRPTKAHEYVFLLTRSARYFYDADAVRETSSPDTHGGVPHNGAGPKRQAIDPHRGVLGTMPPNRNLRSVWSIATEPYPEAHFATFPKALVVPCVKAGTSEKGCCPECGAAWVRQVERTVAFTSGSGRAGNPPSGKNGTEYVQATSGEYDVRMGPAVETRTMGWRPGCDHFVRTDGEDRWLAPIPCTVLDPFAGSGTVGVVALRHGRSFIGIELNPTYAEMARERIRNDGPLFNIAAEVV